MHQDEIARLLPEVFQRTLAPGSALSAWLGVMEDLHAPAEAVLARLETQFDAVQAPDRLLPMLADWVDLTRFMNPSVAADAGEKDLISSGNGRLRELILAALNLSQLRGTGLGLQRFLETATGLRGFEIEENTPTAAGEPRPFHIVVHAPPGARDHESLIRRIVEQEKPAYVTCELLFGAVDRGEDQ
jgi:phage tail-like protein